MLEDMSKDALFYNYYAQWIEVYKKDAIREATMAKYRMTQKWVEKLAPELKVCELTRTAYQKILNDYAKEHERQTTLDFHHQLKGAVMDAVDEGLIERDPTRKAIIKGKTPREKKIKYLNQFELHTLIADLDIKEEPNWDWFILLVAKTGMRFSEALAITPKDFDFGRQTLSISKTWDYKGKGGFLPTKNKSSVRKIQIDWQIVVKFSELVKGLPEDEPIFVGEEKIYNSTVNDALTRHCKACGMAYSNTRIDYEYIINLIQNIVNPEDDGDITPEEKQKKIDEAKQYVEDLRKDNPKVADIMSHLINEIELDESRFKGKSILNIVENMKHECIEQVVSNFCLLWHADKDDVMYAATHYRNGIIPNESAIKASINYPEYKNTVEHALPKFKYYAKFFAELRSTLDDEIKPLV